MLLLHNADMEKKYIECAKTGEEKKQSLHAALVVLNFADFGQMCNRL